MSDNLVFFGLLLSTWRRLQCVAWDVKNLKLPLLLRKSILFIFLPCVKGMPSKLCVGETYGVDGKRLSCSCFVMCSPSFYMKKTTILIFQKVKVIPLPVPCEIIFLNYYPGVEVMSYMLFAWETYGLNGKSLSCSYLVLYFPTIYLKRNTTR